jgi:cell wall-associated NlpC family hydrolase
VATQQAPVAAPGPVSGGILGIAASLAGIPYVYGGTTTAGFDCSGFTQYVFAKVGISIPRTSEAQQAAVTPVSNPQPGDLVFFGSPAYHVGIYAGNGMMWAAPHTGAVINLQTVYSSSATYGRP